MAQVLVVADDLTGANGAAAMFAEAGLRTATVRTAGRDDALADMAASYDVVVASVDCRHAGPDTAARRVAQAVRAGWPARLVCNRIDTTLRGNVGATTAALLTEVRSLTSGHVVVLCAPAHPAAGRHTIGGTQLLNGRRLEETEVAEDARTPMRTSDVTRILRSQAELAVSTLALALVTGGADDLVAAIRSALAGDADVLVVDATTEEHLARLASAAVRATDGTETTWVTTDPGPASVAMARALGIGADHPEPPLLVVSGSVTALTRRQLAHLATDRDVALHLAPRGSEGHAVPDEDATASLLDDVLTAADPGAVVVLATAVEDRDLHSVTAEEADEIPRVLARAVRRALESHDVDGILATGGDVSTALIGELGARGVAVSGQVEPLAVAGSLVGGPWAGLELVTKGGLVGDLGTVVACVDHLRRTAEIRRHHVAPGEARLPRSDDSEHTQHSDRTETAT